MGGANWRSECADVAHSGGVASLGSVTTILLQSTDRSHRGNKLRGTAANNSTHFTH